MSFPSDAIDNVDLKALLAGGLVNEDVLQRIIRLSEVTTPFQDMVPTDVCNQDYTEWVQDDLGSPSLTKVRISGSDAAAYEVATGSRVGNRTQINARTVAVSERAQNSSTVGRANEMAYQTMLAIQRVRQDVEAHAISNQASVIDDNNTTAGKAGGLSAWIVSATSIGATGANGGFNTGSKLVVAPTFGTARALSYAFITGLITTIYNNFGNPTVLMTVPTLVAGLNTFLNSATSAQANRAAPVANITGDGGKVNQTAQGYFQVIVTAFGTALTITPNRMQQLYNSSTACDVLLIDTGRAAMMMLDGYRVKPLAKQGLSDRADVTVDWSLRVDNEKAFGVVRDILPGSAVTA
jgi:hypothetical protein